MNTDFVLLVFKVVSEHDRKLAFAIRKEVFVDEQHVPLHLEDRNNLESIHFLATVNGLPAGTARYRETDQGIKLERFAVLKQFRRMRVGNKLLDVVMKDIVTDLPVYLNAQVDISDFYLKNNFKKVGNEFFEANIKHIKMVFDRE